jgi:drug/metabolite transporter (DMT)-like permease
MDRLGRTLPPLTDQRRALLFGLAAVLCWSTVATAFKISLRYMSPAQLLLHATIVSTVTLLIILLGRGRIGEVVTSTREHWPRALVLGAINPFAYYLVLLEAYRRLPAQEAQAINYTWAFTMTLLAVPLLRHRLRASDVLAAVGCYLGVLVIATRSDVQSLHVTDVGGVALALGSTVLWAMYWLLNARDRRDPVLALTVNFLVSVPMIVVWCVITGALRPVEWPGVAGATYVGVFEMGLTFVLWLSAMRLTTSTARVANLIFISPAVSLLLIHFVLGEPIYRSTPIGLALILGGLAWQRLASGPEPPSATRDSR